MARQKLKKAFKKEPKLPKNEGFVKKYFPEYNGWLVRIKFDYTDKFGVKHKDTTTSWYGSFDESREAKKRILEAAQLSPEVKEGKDTVKSLFKFSVGEGLCIKRFLYTDIEDKIERNNAQRWNKVFKDVESMFDEALERLKILDLWDDDSQKQMTILFHKIRTFVKTGSAMLLKKVLF